MAIWLEDKMRLKTVKLKTKGLWMNPGTQRSLTKKDDNNVDVQ
jgi:hypothetical protein